MAWKGGREAEVDDGRAQRSELVAVEKRRKLFGGVRQGENRADVGQHGPLKS